MVISIKKPNSPPSTDVVAWRTIAQTGQLSQFPPEIVVAAFQDAGGHDLRLREEMARHLSDFVQRHLRKRVGKNKMSDGQDIIDDVRDDFFAAICDPSCADAKGYRESFYGRLNFRLKDAIAAERRASIDAAARAEEKKYRKSKAKKAADPPLDDDAAVEDRTAADAALESDEAAADELFERDPAFGDDGVKRPDPTLMASVDEFLGTIDVERVLAQFTDYRKRTAFRLYMQGVPFGGSKGTVSIAKALEISRKTAEAWVAEVRAFLLEHAPELQALKRRAAGE